MNFDLVPCCVKDCEEVAKDQVTVDHRIFYMCHRHAMEFTELYEQAKKESCHAPD